MSHPEDEVRKILAKFEDLRYIRLRPIPIRRTARNTYGYLSFGKVGENLYAIYQDDSTHTHSMECHIIMPFIDSITRRSLAKIPKLNKYVLSIDKVSVILYDLSILMLLFDRLAGDLNNKGYYSPDTGRGEDESKGKIISYPKHTANGYSDIMNIIKRILIKSSLCETEMHRISDTDENNTIFNIMHGIALKNNMEDMEKYYVFMKNHDKDFFTVKNIVKTINFLSYIINKYNTPTN